MSDNKPATYAFIDAETTSLHPDTGQIWELALILRDAPTPDGDLRPENEYLWQLPVNLEHADPFSLDIGGYWDRRWLPEDVHLTAGERSTVIAGAIRDEDPKVIVPDMDAWAEHVARLLRGRYLVGNVVAFDSERLARLLRWHGQMPTWYYHIIDVESVAAGALGMTPPWSSAEISNKLGVAQPGKEDRHTALGDTRWARDMWDAAVTYRK